MGNRLVGVGHGYGTAKARASMVALGVLLHRPDNYPRYVLLYPFIQVHSALMLCRDSDSRERLIYGQPYSSSLHSSLMYIYMVVGSARLDRK